MTPRHAPPAPATRQDAPQVLPAGPDGIELRFALTPEPAAMAAAQALAAALTESPPPGVTEIAPGLVSVQLGFDPGRTSHAALRAELAARAAQICAAPPAPPAPRRLWTIPAAFDPASAPDLADVARTLSCTPAAAREQLCATDLRVLAIGFAPGQPYLGLLPEPWNLPRRAALTPQVPAGAVVVAVRQIVLFAAASATGWHQIARAAFRPFLPARAEPMILSPGDAIRFAPAQPAEIDALAADPQGLGGARLSVLA